ncbi:MAG: DUF2927 domain-containing protein [Clostridia bacterium]|nr:DUF2927 domain-containing protein [Clostridia bacterium]
MKRAIGRIFLAILVFMAIFGGALAEEYVVTDAQTVRRDAVELLRECAFSSEYEWGDGERSRLIRWEAPLNVYVGGEPGEDDMEFLTQFFTQLQLRVPMFPTIAFTEDESAANVRYYFVPLDDMGEYVSNYTEGNWGYVSFWWNGDFELYDIEIAIATDVTAQPDRNHLMMEEFINGSGISNDHYAYSDSITYQPWTACQTPSELDFAMLNLIYSDFARAGMTEEEFCGACYEYIEGR